MAGNKTDVTTYFRADISQFSESINSLKRYISTVNSEFQLATKGSSNWAKSQDGLKAKITQLNRTLQAQEQIVAELEKEYNKVVEEQGESSTAAQKLTIELNKYRASIDKTKSSIEKYNKSLDQLGKEAKDGGKSLDGLGDSAKDAGDGFTVAKGAIAGFIANGLTALVNGAKNAISGVLGLADATREYRQTLATLDSASQDAGANTDKVRDKFTELMGVFNDQDSITEGLNNLLTAGFKEDALDDITTSLEGAALKWKDTLKFEGMADSLQEWIGSGGESLTGQFAELLERMGYNLDEVKEKTAGMTAEQRRTYATNLLAAEGLNTVSEEYRKNNKDMVDAQTANINYQNAVASMGEKIEPITTKIREGFTKIVEKMLELTEDINIEALAGKIDIAFDKFVNDIIPKIVDGLQWVLDNKDTIIAGVVGIGAAFVAWKATTIIQGVVKAMKAFTLATQGQTIAQRALNLVMKANPIGIIISLISALVAAFVYLWNNCESFRKFWQNLWKNIKSAAKAVADWIGKAFQTAWNAVKNAWSGTKKFFSDIWNSITSTFKNVGSWFSDIFQKAWQGIKNAFSGVKNFFGGIWDSIVSTFRSVGTKVANAIGGAFKSAINAVIGTVERAINNIPNAINGAIDLINQLPNVNISKIPTISLPRLARGGIVDKATLAQIGEAGKEAIVPLERNTQGLKMMAGMVAKELKGAGLGGVTNNYYNNFNNMPTTRYAMKKAMADSQAMWQLYQAIQGGA